MQDYIDSRDEAGTKEAREMIVEIQKYIFQYTIAALKQTYGDIGDTWWVKGIPVGIRKSCMEKWTEKNQEGDYWEYLFLLDYQDIARANWDNLGPVFYLGNKDLGNVKKCLAWLKDLNEIRNITSHPERGALSSDQVQFVRNTRKSVGEFFQTALDRAS